MLTTNGAVCKKPGSTSPVIHKRKASVGKRVNSEFIRGRELPVVMMIMEGDDESRERDYPEM